MKLVTAEIRTAVHNQLRDDAWTHMESDVRGPAQERVWRYVAGRVWVRVVGRVWDRVWTRVWDGNRS